MVAREELHPRHFVFIEGKNTVVSYTAVVWKYLSHSGESFKTYGLSGVFTYPAFRKQGYGLQLITEAKKYIISQDGDIVLFTSQQTNFYQRAGFICIESAKLFKGKPDSPEADPNKVFMLFLSEKAKKNQADFEKTSIYFGEEMW